MDGLRRQRVVGQPESGSGGGTAATSASIAHSMKSMPRFPSCAKTRPRRFRSTTGGVGHLEGHDPGPKPPRPPGEGFHPCRRRPMASLIPGRKRTLPVQPMLVSSSPRPPGVALRPPHDGSTSTSHPASPCRRWSLRSGQRSLPGRSARRPGPGDDVHRGSA